MQWKRMAFAHQHVIHEQERRGPCRESAAEREASRGERVVMEAEGRPKEEGVARPNEGVPAGYGTVQEVLAQLWGAFQNRTSIP